jgi:hypothetical protein
MLYFDNMQYFALSLSRCSAHKSRQFLVSALGSNVQDSVQEKI